MHLCGALPSLSRLYTAKGACLTPLGHKETTLAYRSQYVGPDISYARTGSKRVCLLRNSLASSALAQAPTTQRYERQTAKAKEWLVGQQLFAGLSSDVISDLAQACRSEEVCQGQVIEAKDSKLQDLLIVREGSAQQEGQADARGQ